MISIRKSCILALDLVTIQSRSSPSSFNNASERNSRKTRKRRQRKIRGSNGKDGRRKTRVYSHRFQTEALLQVCGCSVLTASREARIEQLPLTSTVVFQVYRAMGCGRIRQNIWENTSDTFHREAASTTFSSYHDKFNGTQPYPHNFVIPPITTLFNNTHVDVRNYKYRLPANSSSV